MYLISSILVISGLKAILCQIAISGRKAISGQKVISGRKAIAHWCIWAILSEIIYWQMNYFYHWQHELVILNWTMHIDAFFLCGDNSWFLYSTCKIKYFHASSWKKLNITYLSPLGFQNQNQNLTKSIFVKWKNKLPIQ